MFRRYRGPRGPFFCHRSRTYGLPMNDTELPKNTVCSRCGRSFHCGIQGGGEDCWCFSVPLVTVVREGKGCYCPECLAIVSKEGSVNGPSQIP